VILTGNDCGLIKVTSGDGAFRQTAVVPLIETAGVGLIVTVVDTVEEGPLHPFS